MLAEREWHFLYRLFVFLMYFVGVADGVDSFGHCCRGITAHLLAVFFVVVTHLSTEKQLDHCRQNDFITVRKQRPRSCDDTVIFLIVYPHALVDMVLTLKNAPMALGHLNKEKRRAHLPPSAFSFCPSRQTSFAYCGNGLHDRNGPRVWKGKGIWGAADV